MLDSLSLRVFFLVTSASLHTDLLGYQELGEFLVTVKQMHH